MYLLDTNAVIRFVNRSSNNVTERILRAGPDSLLLCSIVKAELMYGAFNSERPLENALGYRELFRMFRSLPFDDACVEEYGQLRALLRRRGAPIGANDLLIAAIALANNLTLVTANTNEFGRISGLRLENWEV